MSKVIQVSVIGIDNNSSTQANYVTSILTDDGKIFQTDDTHAEWIELKPPTSPPNNDKGEL